MVTACSTGLHGPHDVFNPDCPCRDLLDLIANKWSALVIGALEPGPMRFGELRSRLNGVSSKVLTATLRRLEEAALIDREVFAEVPPRVEYTLTDLGHSAAVPLAALRTWAEGALDHELSRR
ncbi:helix-turn-helix transcriptional regulator [Kineosporia rhizophila]|uniref:winged helix-turn-helix transcriptional regulator n=1 Tax=Kineosporia TaxID=49184 RepID=UPI001E4B3F6A|nr:MULTISPECIES: helix-turn-helix domain-containing protein [Kineosporia]MCE0536239.1 helix-turn-helix transcriptional regulator [Kineosporia rhizophila]GLY15173.1 cinnamoyl ester hydrolase [Kineosporia sp. NBRC 101677]